MQNSGVRRVPPTRTGFHELWFRAEPLAQICDGQGADEEARCAAAIF